MALSKKTPLLLCLTLLTGLFIAWQINALLLADQGGLLFGALWRMHRQVPAFVLWQDLEYLIIQGVLYSAFVGIVFVCVRLSGAFLLLSEDQCFYFGIGLWMLAVITLLLTNQQLYPNSVFSNILYSFIPLWLSKILLFLALTLLTVVVLLSVLEGVRLLWIRSRSLVLLGATCLGVLFTWGMTENTVVSADVYRQPNVIIIGLDALRPDRVNAKNTPNVERFLKKSVNFTESVTPEARTFVAWVSILTGRYPKNDGVRFNLTDQDQLSLNDTLANILKQRGYQTIYGSDDMRFSNMSEKFGFQRIIGVPAGINDFILGSINDFPLSNLLMNTRVGEWLFPNSFANRAASVTYRPRAFIQLLSQHLKDVGGKPLFLAVHFCLPHWPYVWAKPHAWASLENSDAYDLSLQRVDQQFRSFLKLLRQQHLLDNAIVVVMSDHGEAFGKYHDRMISQSTYIKGKRSHKDIFKDVRALLVANYFDSSYGHGTDVLSYAQYHNVLAFRRFGSDVLDSHQVSSPVSLVDIKPTILAWLKLPASTTDGISLLPDINQKKQGFADERIRFVESGFTPDSLRDNKFSVHDVAYRSLDLFALMPKTGRVVFKRSAIRQMLLSNKQRAVYYKNWVLALYPNKKNLLIPILVNRDTKQWTDDLTTPFAYRAPVGYMLIALQHFYGSEVVGRLSIKH